MKLERHVGKRGWALAGATLLLATGVFGVVIPSLLPIPDATGMVSTYNVNGPIDESGLFFQSLGTNGRSCSTCHVVGNAMGLSAQNVQERFLRTGGSDPLFAAGWRELSRKQFAPGIRA